jgi:hypothetical protein
MTIPYSTDILAEKVHRGDVLILAKTPRKVASVGRTENFITIHLIDGSALSVPPDTLMTREVHA